MFEIITKFYQFIYEIIINLMRVKKLYFDYEIFFILKFLNNIFTIKTIICVFFKIRKT